MQNLFENEFKDTLDQLKGRVNEVTSIGEQVELHRDFLEALIKEVQDIRTQMQKGFDSYIESINHSSGQMNDGMTHALNEYREKLEEITRNIRDSHGELGNLQESWWKEKHDDLDNLASAWKNDLKSQLDTIAARLDSWKKDHIQTFMNSLQGNIERYAGVFKKQSDELSSRFAGHAESSLIALEQTVSSIREIGTMAEEATARLTGQIETTKEAVEWWIVQSKMQIDKSESLYKDLEKSVGEMLQKEEANTRNDIIVKFDELRLGFEEQCTLLVKSAKDSLEEQKSMQDELMARVHDLSGATGPLLETLDKLVKQLQAFKLQEAFEAIHKKFHDMETTNMEIREQLKTMEESQASLINTLNDQELSRNRQQSVQFYVLGGVLLAGIILLAYLIIEYSF